jgi:carboxymethylenebutenolidase
MNPAYDLPRVTEDDAAITVQQVELRRPDTVLPAYAADPRNVRPNTPSVVVVMHPWGIDEHMREVVRRFAKSGFAAIAPDLYARTDAPEAEKLQKQTVDGDLRAAALWLKTAHPQGKVAVAGFSMGGSIALRQAVDNDDVFDAAAVWYGKVSGVDPAGVRMPIVASYGERDAEVPADSVRAFRKLLRSTNDIVIYPTSGHGFFDHTRDSYIAPAANDAWRRTLAFLTKYLRT